jgi:putative thioredoxin
VNASPLDHQLRYDLAVRLFGDGQFESAINEALMLVRKAGRTWNNGDAPKLVVRFMESLGSDHPLTAPSRRRLTSLLNV